MEKHRCREHEAAEWRRKGCASRNAQARTAATKSTSTQKKKTIATQAQYGACGVSLFAAGTRPPNTGTTGKERAERAKNKKELGGPRRATQAQPLAARAHHRTVCRGQVRTPVRGNEGSNDTMLSDACLRCIYPP